MKQTTVVTVYILTLSLCLVWCACPAHAETRHIALIHSFEPGYPPATKALELLQPLAEQGGVVGKEAKELIGRLRIRQLLDPNGPDVKKYTVRKGDSWIRMVRKLGCSQAMVVHLNGLMDIPALHAGDVFKYRPLDFHVVVNVPEKEICLYDGTDFVKGYPILSMKDGGKKNVETTVKDEQAPVSIYSRQFPSADKTLVLAAGGYVIDAARGTPRSPGFYLSRQDCNELAMLTRPGTKVTILRGKGEEP